MGDPRLHPVETFPRGMDVRDEQFRALLNAVAGWAHGVSNLNVVGMPHEVSPEAIEVGPPRPGGRAGKRFPRGFVRVGAGDTNDSHQLDWEVPAETGGKVWIWVGGAGGGGSAGKAGAQLSAFNTEEESGGDFSSHSHAIKLFHGGASGSGGASGPVVAAIAEVPIGSRLRITIGEGGAPGEAPGGTGEDGEDTTVEPHPDDGAQSDLRLLATGGDGARGGSISDSRIPREPGTGGATDASGGWLVQGERSDANFSISIPAQPGRMGLPATYDPSSTDAPAVPGGPGGRSGGFVGGNGGDGGGSNEDGTDGGAGAVVILW